MQGLREFQAHVEPLVYPVLSLTRRPPIPSQPGCCGAKTLRGHVCCFVDPLRLIKGTSHKLLWGTGHRVGGNHILASGSIIVTHRQSASLIQMSSELLLKRFTFPYIFSLSREWIFNLQSLWTPRFSFSSLLWQLSKECIGKERWC